MLINKPFVSIQFKNNINLLSYLLQLLYTGSNQEEHEWQLLRGRLVPITVGIGLIFNDLQLCTYYYTIFRMGLPVLKPKNLSNITCPNKIVLKTENSSGQYPRLLKRQMTKRQSGSIFISNTGARKLHKKLKTEIQTVYSFKITAMDGAIGAFGNSNCYLLSLKYFLIVIITGVKVTCDK